MRRWWPVWGGRATRRPVNRERGRGGGRRSGRSASRPRVAHAVAAAHAAQVGQAAQAADDMTRVWWARARGGLDRHQYSFLHATPAVLWAPARVEAQGAGDPAALWAEAVGAWLGGWDQPAEAEAPLSGVSDARRVHAWRAIDTTMGQLRAS